MLPEGWRRCTIDDIAKVSSGGTPDRSRDEYWGGDIPWVTTGEIGNGPIDHTAEKITEIGLRNSAAKIFPAGTLLMAMYGQGKTRGRIAALSIKASTNQACAAIIAAEDSSADFLFHNLRSRYEEIRNLSNDGSQKNLSAGLIKALPILLPPLPEQRKIAEILSTWDAAISAQERLIANAKRQKKALMQTLLPTGAHPPKKRLPGFSEEWREILLGTAFTERVERGDDRLPLLSVTQANGVISQDDAGRRNISSDDQSNYKTVRKGDIAYNTMRMWQGASALSGLTGKVSPAYTVVAPRDGHDAAFYAYLFKQAAMIHVFERHSQGLVSDTWNLKFPHFAKIRTCAPGIEEQQAIARTLKSLDDLAFACERQLTALSREKSALMQQLLTGKRRVKLEESVA
ncbi:MAG: restriction endonuclease subunit S [Sphingorhabdus sp.]|uniref:restriction endonuclease subunit S n=1 Tax=Sphingorhabdus sp. TaxID=1902408 RepID=UPI0025F64D78|nr:restriction endonuclease subunit S [Sphingorhabdus sp.]MCO4090365.1 restriction endonuclease subunit S [Sphingorhabdus sp.]